MRVYISVDMEGIAGVVHEGQTDPTDPACAAEYGRFRRAATIFITCGRVDNVTQLADVVIDLQTGPEVIAGSTRMKAGTAQKLILNTISTVTMVRLGKTYGNLMVDVVATNAKLRGRVRRAIALATGASAGEVEAALEAAGGEAKVAIVSLLAGVDAEAARARLRAAGGTVRGALAPR